jgi:hypothetical protein
MLSGLRFVIGAILATAMLGVGSLGLYATVKLRHQASEGPIESSRNLMFGDRADWNPFYYADSAARFEELTRQPGASETAEAPPSAAAGGAENMAQPAAVVSADDDSSKERAADKWADEPPPVIAGGEVESRDHDRASAVVNHKAGTPAR